MWKHGLFQLDPDQALSTMVGDSRRDELIIGKTREELTRMFGQLKSPKEAIPYYRGAYLESSYRDVAFLRNSPWMVVFENGKASKLVLIKGA